MKTIIFFITSFFSVKSNKVVAQDSLVIIDTPQIVQPTPPPPIRLKHISDHLHLYSDSQALFLDSVISEFENSDSIEITLLTTDTASSQEGFDALTLDSARRHHIGDNFNKKGILIGISPNLRYMRIQNTNAIMRILSNYETKTIVDNEFTPYFKLGQYYEGTLNGLISIVNTLKINNKPSRNSR